MRRSVLERTRSSGRYGSYNTRHGVGAAVAFQQGSPRPTLAQGSPLCCGADAVSCGWLRQTRKTAVARKVSHFLYRGD